MAESFTTGAVCSVGEIEARYSGPFDTHAWKDFCDCMFLQPQVVETYFCNGQPIPSAVLATLAGNTYAERAKKFCDDNGGKLTITAEVQAVRTANWQKCMTRACLSPGGCFNSDRGTTDGFNANPGMAFAPWTDLGGAARGIPQRNEGFITLVGQFIVIRPEEYTPLALWTTYWTDLPKFVVLAVKTSIFAPPLALYVDLIATGAGMLPMASLALAQCAAEGKDPIEYVWTVAIKGALKQGTWFLQLAGPLLGQQWAKAGGIAIQLFSQDAIDNGHVRQEEIADPTTRAVIHLFAKHGKDIGNVVQGIIDSIGTDGLDDLMGATGISGVFDTLGTIFHKLNVDPASTSLFSPDVLKVFKLAEIMCCSGYEISHGVTFGKDVFTISDNVCFCVFGFRLTALKSAAQRGTKDVAALLKGGSLTDASKNLADLLSLTANIAAQLRDAGKQIGCGIDKLADLFEAFVHVFNGVTSDVETTIFAVSKPAALKKIPSSVGARIDAGPLTVAPSAMVKTPLVRAPLNVAPPLPKSLAPVTKVAPVAPPSTGGAGLAVAGAGAGFLAGGPMGALIGAGVGLFLGNQSTPSKTPFAGYTVRRGCCNGQRKK